MITLEDSDGSALRSRTRWKSWKHPTRYVSKRQPKAIWERDHHVRVETAIVAGWFAGLARAISNWTSVYSMDMANCLLSVRDQLQHVMTA
jgi:hypothetical protein